MSFGATVVVNFDALEALARRLQCIQIAFESMGAHPSVDGVALGDSGLTGEFERFLDGWSQGRRQIATELTAVAKAVSSALATYGQADHGIAADEQGSTNRPGASTAPAGTAASHG